MTLARDVVTPKGQVDPIIMKDKCRRSMALRNVEQHSNLTQRDIT
jgi:hypothetical protein